MVAFVEYVISMLSISIIANIFTFRFINAFLEYILLPVFNILIDPGEHISKINFTFNTGKNKNEQMGLNSNPNANIESPSYDIACGAFFKEFLIWITFMVLLYFGWGEIAEN
jgi:hypothetical protein